ncbi:serine protease [Rhizobium leguminosarum bv. viciae]|nr:serine protease [Rhizobium leguminosarum bv. viciae]TBZ88997.1 serine protease [Rhizobium leguminosarum bv. viciae]
MECQMPLADHPNYPITVATCEDRSQDRRLHALVPEQGGTAALFRFQDPFGLRKAIVPIFQADRDNILTGMGTGFALDPWGSFLTADHVTDFLREGANQSGQTAIRPDLRALALLGMGLVFGEVGVPREALALMASLRTPLVEVEDPLNFVAAASTRPIDVTFLNATMSPPSDMIGNLPLRRHPSTPGVGELVVAIGFPEIKLAHGAAPDLPTSITEGMFAAYGVVTRHHPEGRDRSAPTPVFEVRANWPSGMSGGPVFNAVGEVIGLVSRSIAPAGGEELGTAWATWLAASIPPEHPTVSWPESIDPDDLHFRRAWGALRLDPWTLEGFPSTQADATALADSLGDGFEARIVSQRLGTETYSTTSLA